MSNINRYTLAYLSKSSRSGSLAFISTPAEKASPSFEDTAVCIGGLGIHPNQHGLEESRTGRIERIAAVCATRSEQDSYLSL